MKDRHRPRDHTPLGRRLAFETALFKITCHRLHLNSGHRAMAVAMMYPEATPGQVSGRLRARAKAIIFRLGKIMDE